MSASFRLRPELINAQFQTAFFTGPLTLLNHLPKPPQVVYLVAVGVYSAAVGLHYYLHRGNYRQDLFLIGGVLIGVESGFVLGFDLQSIVMVFLPWFALLSLELNSGIHSRIPLPQVSAV
jgi:uncharacterized membrane protein YfcA